MSEPSDGQKQAVRQLRRIEAVTEGRVRVEKVNGPILHGSVTVEITIECSGLDERTSLVVLEGRERFSLLVEPLFPFVKPEVQTPHLRFANQPNVVWGQWICLYLAENEWNPSEGMHDCVGRLLRWLRALADGSLTGPQINWHPPLTNTARSPGFLIVGVDLAAGTTAAWALIEAIGGRRYELRQWLPSRPAKPPLALRAGRYFLAPVLVLPQPVGFAFPTDLDDLYSLLEAQGIATEQVQRLRESPPPETFSPWWTGRPDPDAQPLHLMIIGSPAPHRTASHASIAHLAVWQMNKGQDPDGPDLVWMRVFDQRPQAATRRDTTRPVTWLTGKRVAVLGCGGLGAPVAEFCIRAGASKIRLADNGVVTPGILVRQPYAYAEIGRPKAEVLAERLRATAPSVAAESLLINAADYDAAHAERDAAGLDAADLASVDLVIDATASPAVAARLEFIYWSAGVDGGLPPLLSMSVGHRCERGLVTVALPGASGAGVDLLRRLGLAAAHHDDLADVLDDFFPAPPRAGVFQPEPGCSDPTYVGSAADLAVFAGTLLNEGLSALRAAEQQRRDVLWPRRFASLVRLSSDYETAPGPRRLFWLNDLPYHEESYGYQVRFAPETLAAMRVEAVRTAEERGPDCETGGLLLGQIDHGARVIWVTEADSLAPDSHAASHELSMSPRSVDAYVDKRRRRTHGLVSYVGAWHTHPGVAAQPSELDERALTQLTSSGAPSLLVIVGGPVKVWNTWLDGKGRPHVYARLAFPDEYATTGDSARIGGGRGDI